MSLDLPSTLVGDDYRAWLSNVMETEQETFTEASEEAGLLERYQRLLEAYRSRCDEVVFLKKVIQSPAMVSDATPELRRKVGELLFELRAEGRSKTDLICHCLNTAQKAKALIGQIMDIRKYVLSLSEVFRWYLKQDMSTLVPPMECAFTRLQAERDEWMEEAQILREEVSKLMGNVRKLTNRVEELETVNESVLAEERRSYLDKVNQLESEKDRIKRGLTKDQREWENEFRSQRRSIEMLQDQLCAVTEALTNEKAAHEATRCRAQNLAMEAEAKTQQAKELEEEVSTMLEQMTKLRETLDAMPSHPPLASRPSTASHRSTSQRCMSSKSWNVPETKELQKSPKETVLRDIPLRPWPATDEGSSQSDDDDDSDEETYTLPDVVRRLRRWAKQAEARQRRRRERMQEERSMRFALTHDLSRAARELWCQDLPNVVCSSTFNDYHGNAFDNRQGEDIMVEVAQDIDPNGTYPFPSKFPEVPPRPPRRPPSSCSGRRTATPPIPTAAPMPVHPTPLIDVVFRLKKGSPKAHRRVPTEVEKKVTSAGSIVTRRTSARRGRLYTHRGSTD